MCARQWCRCGHDSSLLDNSSQRWKGRRGWFPLGVGRGWALSPTLSSEGFAGGWEVGEGRPPSHRLQPGATSAGERHRAEGVTEMGQVQVRENRPHLAKSRGGVEDVWNLPAFRQMLFSRCGGRIGRRRPWRLDAGNAELVRPLCGPRSAHSQGSLLILGVNLGRRDSPSTR